MKARTFMMVASQYPPVYGGAGSQAALLARSLVDMGWRGRVVTLDQSAVGSDRRTALPVHRILRGVSPRSRPTRLLTTIALGAFAGFSVLRWRPSVVHVHGAYWWSIPAILAAKMVGAATLLKSTRDGEDDAGTLINKRVGGVRVGSIYALSLRLTDAFIVLNSRSREIAERYGYGSKTFVMLNGVDTEGFQRTPERRELARTKYALGPMVKVHTFVGYVVPHKGAIDLLNAWRSANVQGAELWLVGPTTGFYRELDDRVPDLIASLREDGFAVREFGHVPLEALPEIYWATDQFVLPSYAEGMPNSLLEAIVGGCSILASRIPGVVDILAEGEGVLVTPGDVSAIASALLNVDAGIPKGSTRERLAMQSVAQSYSDLYEQLLASK